MRRTIAAVAKVAPGLEFGLFDLPAVTAIGARQLDAQAVRVTPHPGDFRNDAMDANATILRAVTSNPRVFDFAAVDSEALILNVLKHYKDKIGGPPVG